LKNNIILFKKTTVVEYMQEVVGIDKKTIESFGRVADAQVLYPHQLIPKDAYELFNIDKEIVKKIAKIYNDAWSRILDGISEESVYNWVTEQLGELLKEEESEIAEVEVEVKEEEEEKEEEKGEEEEKKKESKKKTKRDAVEI